MTEREKMLAGEMYVALDPELDALRARSRRLYEAFNGTGIDELEQRGGILRELLGSAGSDLYIEPNFKCDYGLHTHVGDRFFANFDCVILDAAEVRIGDNCMLAPMVGIYTATHPLDPAARNSGREYAKPITIGHNAWLGAGCIICPGVTLGDNVVVAAGAVVTKSFGDNVVLGGNPARILKEIEA